MSYNYVDKTINLLATSQWDYGFPSEKRGFSKEARCHIELNEDDYAELKRLREMPERIDFMEEMRIADRKKRGKEENHIPPAEFKTEVKPARKVHLAEYRCPICTSYFSVEYRKNPRSKTGILCCSRSCSGVYNVASKPNRITEELKKNIKQNFVREYYK